MALLGFSTRGQVKIADLVSRARYPRTTRNTDLSDTRPASVAIVGDQTARPFDTLASVTDSGPRTIFIIRTPILTLAIDADALVETIDGVIADIGFFTQTCAGITGLVTWAARRETSIDTTTL